MSIIGIGGAIRRRTLPNAEPGSSPKITRLEERLLQLLPASAIASPGTKPRPRPEPKYRRAAFALCVLGAFAVAPLVIDRGGQATPVVPNTFATFSAPLHNTGRLPVVVQPGDITVRVNVTAQPASSVWFWCLESSRGLPFTEHLCRDSSLPPSGNDATLSGGVVHLDDASVRGAALFVQMYCRDTCDWQAEVKPVQQPVAAIR